MKKVWEEIFCGIKRDPVMQGLIVFSLFFVVTMLGFISYFLLSGSF